MGNKNTLIQVVERYHKRYLEYETAFNKNPFSQEELMLEVKKMADTDADIDDPIILDKMIDIVIEKPQKKADVNTSAIKFMLAADFYYQITDEELPPHIQKDYEDLPIRKEMKTFYSIENGDFIKNESTEVDENMKNYMKSILGQIKNT